MPKPEPNKVPMTFQATDGITFMSEVARNCYESSRANLEAVLAYQAHALKQINPADKQALSDNLRLMAEYRRPFEESVARWLHLSVTFLRVRPDGGIVTINGN